MSTTPPSLLAVFAHPDDEAFGSGGVLAKHAASGTRVTLVCATRGECGEISSPELATPETLGAVREQELRLAGEALGVRDIRFLDCRDSGMDGTPENDDPRALINQRADDVVRKLVAIVREVRPQVVLTFEPYGGYGHPDHIAIHHHVSAAVQAAGVPTYGRDLGEPWRAVRLVWQVFPRSIFLTMRDELRRHGEDTSRFDEMERTGAGWPDELVDIVVDVSAYTAAKQAAFRAHRTQFGDDNLFRKATDALCHDILGREHFFVAMPWRTGNSRLRDLFEGL